MNTYKTRLKYCEYPYRSEFSEFPSSTSLSKGNSQSKIQLSADFPNKVGGITHQHSVKLVASTVKFMSIIAALGKKKQNSVLCRQAKTVSLRCM